MVHEALVPAIKKNKLYSSLPDSFVEQEIASYLQMHPEQRKFTGHVKSKQLRTIVMSVRTRLHALHGRFQTKKKRQREMYLQQLPTMMAQEKILQTHTSTRERLPVYKQLYKTLFSITGKPKSILDLGCGMNPVSFMYMGLHNARYHAYDIDEEDVAFLQQYFAKMHQIKGKAMVLDIRQVEKVKVLPKADVAFLLKVVDPLEGGKGHKLSEALIKSIPARWMVVSFSTKTVSGKQMRHPHRGWLEKMLGRLSLAFTSTLVENEVFYVISKN